MSTEDKSDHDVRVERFLRLLGEATDLTGIEIGGCGCCGSPFLEDTELSGNLHYVAEWDRHPGGGGIEYWGNVTLKRIEDSPKENETN